MLLDIVNGFGFENDNVEALTTVAFLSKVNSWELKVNVSPFQGLEANEKTVPVPGAPAPVSRTKTLLPPVLVLDLTVIPLVRVVVPVPKALVVLPETPMPGKIFAL